MIKHYEGSSCQTIMSTKAAAALANPTVAQQLRAQVLVQHAGAHAAGAPSALRPRGDAGAALRREPLERRREQHVG